MNVVRLNPGDLALFVRAVILARRAQRIRSVPLPTVVADLAGRRSTTSAQPVDRLSLAADRASARWSRWFGGVDSCLTRSLVLGGLLAGRGGVSLNVGFREEEDGGPGVAGHAWVTLDGLPIGSDGHLAETSYTRVLEVPYGEKPIE